LQNDGALLLSGNTRFSAFGANADHNDMLCGNSDCFNIQFTKTILDGLGSNSSLGVYLTADNLREGPHPQMSPDTIGNFRGMQQENSRD
jgi:hypothetical protein